MWASLARVDLFPVWWPWMKDVELVGGALEAGSSIAFRIDPPVPYQMRICVEVTDSSPGEHIEGSVTGDLRGDARLELRDAPGGVDVTTAWDVELVDRGIRSVIVVARPLLLWAQHWAVEVSLRGFRRYLKDEIT